MPVLSIITINYNNKAGLEKTLKSIVSQTNLDFEFIIIDGASSDGSVDIINANKKHINYWVSEKDNGIYDAQNKGIKKATGNYLLFLNSGDTFFNTSVVANFNQFIVGKNYGIVYGNSNLKFLNKPDLLLSPPQKLDITYLFKCNLNHQACFIQRNFFDKYGMYDTKYKICADFDFFFNVFVHEPESYTYFNSTVCNYEDGGISAVKENYKLMVSEKESILKTYLSKKDYATNYKIYRKQIPLKYRILDLIYKVPVLNWIFKNIYQIAKPNG